MIAEEEIYEVLGEAGFTALVGSFYRQVRTDDLLGPLYPPEDLDGAEQRLRSFLIQRFGGPSTYSVQRGHPRLRMRHAPFPVDAKAAERWMVLMDQAMKECELTPEIDAVLRKYFEDTARFMINR